jgi:hypothetical protein
MSPATTTERISGTSSPHKVRITAVFYLLTILTGVVVFFFGSGLSFLVDVIVTGFYIGVTALFYVLTGEE